MKKIYLSSVSQWETGENYQMDVCFDFANERIRIDEYKGDINQIIRKSKELAQKASFTKVIIKSRLEDWRFLFSHGFQLEGIIESYFNGKDMYFMVFYLSDNRRMRRDGKKEDELLEKVLETTTTIMKDEIPSDYSIRIATTTDSHALGNLYHQLFSTYPTPINDPTYLSQAMAEHSIFYVVEWRGTIISAAGAYINRTDRTAEVTHCGTMIQHRGFRWMQRLLVELEKELIKQKINCIYSLARAGSYGMNACLKKADYQYNGRLVNNCYINNKYEDMNVWVKKLV